MISRAACAPRICLTCRTSIAHRGASRGLRAIFRRDGLRWRSSSSHSREQDNERIKALISGQIEDRDAKRQSADRKSSKRVKWREYNGKHEQDNMRIRSKEDVENSIRGFAKRPELEENAQFEKVEINKKLPILPEILEEGAPEPAVEAEPTQPATTEDLHRRPGQRNRKPSSKSWLHELLQNRPLGVSALGVPADALIIKNPNKMRFPRKAITESKEEAKPTGPEIDWQGLMPKEDREGVDMSDEAMKNIEELRPSEDKIRLKDFEKLTQALLDGFTLTQLKAYYRDHDPVESASDNSSMKLSWALKQIPWTPVKSLRLGHQTPKKDLAHRIILSKWDIAIRDQVDGLGRAFIWVRPDLYPLLVQGSRPIVERLRKAFLDEASNERISTTSDAYRLNIVARQSSTYAILERIGGMFQSMQHRTIAIKEFMKEIPSATELVELGRITNTSIKQTKGGKDPELEVSWFPQERLSQLDESEEQLPLNDQAEDLGDIVLRLLISQPQQGLVSETQVIPPRELSDAQGGIFTGFCRETKTMAWADKIRRWSRYIEPVGMVAPQETSPLNLAEAASFPEIIQAKNDKTSTITTATFGHILHSEPETDLAKLTKNRRILAPVLPHPAAFSTLKPDNDEALTQATAIILNFAPLSDNTDSMDSKAPALQLRLPVDPEADLSNFSLPKDATLNGIILSHVTDLLLPGQGVDVRLSHQRLLPLDIQQQDPLRDFLYASELNLLAGRLRTPSRAQFSIPANWLTSKARGVKKSKSNNIPYLFRGLEIHQTINVPWHGHTLRYTTIEAGLHGGQRQELTLHANSSKPFAESNRESFLKLSEELAAGVHFSWTEGFRSMKAQRFEDHSYDLPEETLPEGIATSEQNLPIEDFDTTLRIIGRPSIAAKSAPLPTNEYPFEEDDEDIFAGMDDFTPKEKAQFRRDFEAAVSLDAEFEADMDTLRTAKEEVQVSQTNDGVDQGVRVENKESVEKEQDEEASMMKSDGSSSERRSKSTS